MTFASCFEYRCSVENSTTFVVIDISDSLKTLYGCFFYKTTRKRAAEPDPGLYAPVLNSTVVQPGYFLNEMSNVTVATNQCVAETQHYAGTLFCHIL